MGWPRTVLIRSAGLATCAAAAGAVHWLVHGEHVGDAVGLALTGAVTIGLALALVASVRAATRGIWRRRGVAPALRAAEVLPPLTLLAIGTLFAQASLVDTSVAMEAIVEADRVQPAALLIGPGGGDVRLAGEITEGVADRLEALLLANPRVRRIHLTSDGGLADEGQALGDVIAAHALATFVPDYCVSACTLAFARGRERLVMDDARLGYHAPYEQGLFGALYRDDAGGQRAAYLAAGLAPTFVDRALAVEPANIWFPSQAELLVAGAVTGVVDHDALPDSGLDGADTPAGARALVLRNVPLLRPLAARHATAIATIAGWYLDRYRSGRSEGENMRGLRLLARGAIASALLHGDDAAIGDLGRALVGALGDATDPEACARIAGDGDLLEATAQSADRDPGAVAAATGLLDRILRGGGAVVAVPPVRDDAIPTARDPSCPARRRELAAVLALPGGTGVLRARLGASVMRSLALLTGPARRPPGRGPRG